MSIPTAPLEARLSTLVMIRWLAVGGQALTIGVVHVAVAELALLPVMATVAVSALLNAGLTVAPGLHRRLEEHRAARHLAFDIVQLAVLIGLTGGLSNPFSLFILAPVTVAAATLPMRRTVWLAVLAVVAVSALARWHQPLPWPPPGLLIPVLYVFGMWMALVLGVASVAFFTWRMAEEGRRIASAYSESRLALAQEQRVAEVGALAAAVAHELNTPLATVCLLAREVAAEMNPDDPLRADMETLIGQTQRCRDTLARLTLHRPRAEAVEAERVPFPFLVEMAAAVHVEEARVPVAFDHRAADFTPAPWMEHSPEILHGLGNFIQNAIQFAGSRVEVETSWDDRRMGVRIADDGGGFPEHLLSRLGEPYLSGRSQAIDSHLGLGVFIAVTLLARTGAKVEFANAAHGGAEIRVSWRRSDGAHAVGG